MIEIPAGVASDQKSARYRMLERLADFDDELMEQLLSDIEPPRDIVFDDLAKELRSGQIMPLLIGSATGGHGVTRLLKALRHEVARRRQDARAARHRPERAAARPSGAHDPHRSWRQICRSRACCAATSATARRYGLGRPRGARGRLGAPDGRHFAKISRAEEGDTLAFQKLDSIETGDRFVDGKAAPAAPAKVPPPPPTQAVAIHVKDRKDEVRVAAALAKLTEEDTALGYVQDQESSEMKLYGQGEMHLRVTIERLDDRFGVKVETRKPTVAYRETIREMVTVHGRHKKQSGGHGQFGDVIVEVGPRERGEGFLFTESVHGGTVPRQYFSSVENGAKDALTRGPLGFQVVDVSVNLIDGSYHTVDSSDMAFRAAAKLALGEALPKASPSCSNRSSR